MADVITLNEIEEVKNLVGINNTEDANGTLSQKSTAIFNFVKSRIGAPTDGGGTTQQGSIMAKLNALLNANLTHGMQTYSTAGSYTWVAPEGVGVVYVSLVGGGGGGGGGAGAIYNPNYDQHYNVGSSGGGGGAGIYGEYVTTVTPGTSYTVVVGSGGTAGSAGPRGEGTYSSSYGFSVTTNGSGGNGGNGGQTKFNNIVVPGGTGGKGATMISGTNNPGSVALTKVGSAGGSTINKALMSGHRVILNNPGTNGKQAPVGYGNYKGANNALTGGAGGSGYLSAGSGGSGGSGGIINYNGYTVETLGGSAGSAGGAGKVIIRW
jgi:hypothetical protein